MGNHRVAIEEAINHRKQMRISYTDRLGKKEEFLLEPNYLFKHHGKLYTIAYNYNYSDIRMFRLSRISTQNTLDIQSKHYPIYLKQVDFGADLNKSDINFIAHPKGLATQRELSASSNSSDFSQKLRLSKMTETGLCRSPLELKVLRKLNVDPNVQSLTVEPFSIPYRFQGVDRKYIPDVMVNYIDGHTEIVEIKMSLEMYIPKNQAKFEAAERYCHEQGFAFKVMGIDGGGLGSSSTFPQWSTDHEQASVRVFDHRYGRSDTSTNKQAIVSSAGDESSPERQSHGQRTFWTWTIVIVAGVVILVFIFK